MVDCQQFRRVVRGLSAAAVVLLFPIFASPLHAAGPSAGSAAAAGPNDPRGPGVRAQMRIDGLNGNNPTAIVGFSLGATNSASSSDSGGGAGKVTFANLVVSKLLDADSVPLLQAAATGQILRSVVIELFDAGNVPFATYTFQDVVVTSTVLGSSTSAVTEQDAFDFRTITSNVTINGQTFHSCFDVKALSSCS